MQTYYKGANGLEYLSPEDAENYGEGLVSKRVVGQVEETTSISNELPDEVNDEGKLVQKSDEQIDWYSLEVEELKAVAKARGIKGWQLLKKDNLIKKIMESK